MHGSVSTQKASDEFEQAGAQALLNVKTAALNGTLHRYTQNFSDRGVTPGFFAIPAEAWLHHAMGSNELA